MGIETVTRIGDCLQPGLIAMAVQSGHKFVRTVEEQREDLFKREDQNYPRNGFNHLIFNLNQQYINC